MGISTRSRKAKGRKLQDYVRETLRYIFRNKLEDDDIKCAIMGQNGEDLVLSPAAKKLIPFAIECKNQEKLNIHSALKQAETNAKDRIPLLIFTKNRTKKYVALEYHTFLKLMYPDFNESEMLDEFKKTKENSEKDELFIMSTENK
jgi:hypothetical protein